MAFDPSSFISGILGLGSSAAGAFLSYESQKKLMKHQHKYNLESMEIANKYSRQNMQKGYTIDKQLQKMQNQFTKNMSNTAHQREVADLKAAGLNPILSANNGASTPSAGGAIVGSPSASALGVSSQSGVDFDASAAFDNWLSTKNLKNQTKQTESNVDLNDATQWKMRKEASLLGEQARNEAERYDSILADRELTRAQINKVEQDRLNSMAATAANIKFLENNGSALLQQANAAVKNSEANFLNASANDYKAHNWSHGFHDEFGVTLPGVGINAGPIGIKVNSASFKSGKTR